MRTLFDASAILNIVRSYGYEALDYMKGSYELTLTPYEVGNAVWKEATLLGRLTPNEALELINHLSKLQRFLDIITPTKSLSTLALANELRITYYDASYIEAAGEQNAILVTDDLKLKEIIRKKKDVIGKIIGKEVEAITSAEYVNRVKQAKRK